MSWTDLGATQHASEARTLEPPPRARFLTPIAVAGSLLAGAATASTVTVQDDNPHLESFAARFTIVSTCSETNVDDVTDPSGVVTACDTLNVDGTVSGTTTLRAGDRVVLREGFSVPSGTSLAVEIEPSLFPDAYLQDDTPARETSYAAGFYVDPTALSLSDTDRFLHFIARDAAGDPVLTLGIKYNSSLAELRAYIEVVEDGGDPPASTENGNELVLTPNQYQWVEVGWIAGAGTGEAYICVETTCQVLTNLDTATKKVHSVRWGAMDVGANANLGSLDVDQFESRRATPSASL